MKTPVLIHISICIFLVSCVQGQSQLIENEEQSLTKKVMENTDNTQIPPITSPIFVKTMVTSESNQPFDAIVNVSALQAFSEPRISNVSIYTFSLQDTLRIIGRNSDCTWIEVITPHDEVGWVNTQLDRVKFIIPCDLLPHGFLQPENGAVIFDKRYSLENGELSIENGLSQDSFIVLTDTNKKAIIGFYIRANNEFTLKGIPDGKYYVFFSIGSKWDIVDSCFIENVTYQRFQDILNFTSNSTSFSIWELTLHPVEEGTAFVIPLSVDEFPILLK